MQTSIYKRAGRARYYLSYWDAKLGKYRHVVTRWRTDDPSGKKHALAFAADIGRQNAALREASVAEAWDAWVPAFFSEKYRNSPLTLTRMNNALDWLRVYWAEHQLTTPDAVNYRHVIDYVKWRTAKKRHCGKNISRNTALTEVKAWSVVMREAIRRGFTAANPCERTGLGRDRPRLKPEITAAEMAVIRGALAAQEGGLPVAKRWMTTSFEIAIHQGCRLKETQVKLHCVDAVARTIQFTGKGRNGVPNIFTTALHPALVPLMKELERAGAAVTCVHPAMPSKHWHTFFKKLGLSHLCFHCTRVTVITRLARQGVPIQQAMRYVGHANQTVHQIYQRLQAADLTRCTDALSFDGPTAG